MKIIAILLVLCILVSVAPATGKGGFFDGLGEGIAQIIAFTTIKQLTLYAVVAAYHEKFNKWPASKEDIAKALTDGAVKVKEESKGDPMVLLESMDVTFTDLGDGTALIEARYPDDFEETLKKGGMGKFRISAIASCDKGEYIFTPSEKTKNNRDYFTIPGKLKTSAPGI